MTKTISFVLRKGGSGKSTSVAHTAVGLSKLGKKVLIIDFDPQASATNLFGLFSKKGAKREPLFTYHIQNLITDSSFPIEKALYKTNFDVDVLPSFTELKNGFITLLTSGNTLFLRNVVTRLENFIYDYILIDTPPEEGIAPLNALGASDYVIIPMQTDADAQEAVNYSLAMINNVQNSFNPRLRLLGILPTLHYGVASVSKMVLEEAEGSFPDLIFKDILIKHTKWFKEASFLGVPLSVLNEQAFLSSGYHEFAKKLIEEIEYETTGKTETNVQ